MEFSNFKKSNTRATEEEIQQLKKELDKVYQVADGLSSSCSVDELYKFMKDNVKTRLPRKKKKLIKKAIGL
jgi:hypothetical protein